MIGKKKKKIQEEAAQAEETRNKSLETFKQSQDRLLATTKNTASS